MTTYLDGQPLHNEVSVPVNSSTKLTMTVNDIIIHYSPTGHVLRIQGRTDNGADGTFYLDNVSLVVTDVLGVSGDLELSVPASAELAPGETLQCAVTNTTIGAALVAGEDYVITTEEVIASSSSSLAGCWRVIATGQGDYAGQAATNYTRVALKEDAEDYDYAMAITPNASYVTSTLVDFPLLVRLSSTRQSGFSPADCGAGGANLRFILADGTLLAHEIDYWDALGESTVWVRVPALAADTVLYALWSPKSGTVHHPPRNPKAVWCDYVGVWHLSEAGATAYDSSVNNYTAVNASPVSAAANPPVGRAAFATNFFETSVTDLFAADAAKPITSRSRVTFSGWLTVDSAARSDYGSGYYIYKKYVGWNDQTGGGSVCYLPDFVNNPSYSSAIVQVFLNSGTGGSDVVNTYPAGSRVASKRQTWIYLAISLDGATKAYYFDGVQTGTEAATHGILGPDNTAPVVFGPPPTKTSTGRGDEIRIRDGVVSAAWALADYRNMATQDFVSYGSIGKKTFSVPALADVTLADVSVAATPAVAPVDDLTGDALTLNTDYTLVYADNTFGNVTGKAIVTGIGKYEGCVATNTFEILGVGSIDLAADADWSAYANPRIAASATVDLKGYDLTVSMLYAGGTVTDSVGGGRLIFDVPAGKTVTLNTALTGALKLVKTGAGLLVASRTGQTYTGGNDVLGGVLRCGGNGNMANSSYIGLNSTTVRCYVYVGPNGILDPAGSDAWGYHAVTLDGGMVSNTVARTGTSSSCFNPLLSTTGDVALVTMGDYSWPSVGGDLRGGTLAIEVYNYLTAYSGGWVWSNGTIHFKRGGWIKTTRSAANMPNVDFRQTNGALDIANAMSVHDYYCSYGGDYYEGSAALNVYGTFTPASTYFYGPTMQNGSSIDLGSKSGAWSTTSPNNGHHNGNKVVKFEANARVGIGLGERTFSGIEKVVSYTSEPSTVTFTNNEWVLSRREDGVYVVGSQAPGAPILPPVIPVQYIRGGQPAEPELSLVNAFTGVALENGTDYTAAFADNETQGTASVTVTGQGAYAGLAFTERFTIVQALAAAAAVPPAARMDGTIDWSGVSVTDAGTGAALVEGVDYTKSYTLSGGTATATITGIGNYIENEIVYTFDISPRAYFTDFRNRLEITVGEGMVTTELANFPALVRLSAAAVDGFDPAECGEGGSEIGFLMENGGELLPCEVDYWNPEGESTVWVKVPLLTADTRLYVVFGRNPGRAAIAPNPKRVWSAYAGVWHMSPAGDSARIAYDSTANGYDGTNTAATAANSDAMVGTSFSGVYKTGVGDLRSASAAKPLAAYNRFTVEGWLKCASTSKYDSTLLKGTWINNSQRGWACQLQNSLTKWSIVGPGINWTQYNVPSFLDTWKHVVSIYNGTTSTLYVNGSLVGNGTVVSITDNTIDLLTIHNSGNSGTYIDEARLYDGVESATYIAANYKTMTQPGFFVYGKVKHWRIGSVYYIR